MINGSPRGEDSDTLRITRALLEGLETEAEVVHTAGLQVHFCMGCYACWYQTPGECILRDDMEPLIRKITAADRVIWSTPLYYYGFPGPLKLVIDRLLPLYDREQTVGEDGYTLHAPGPRLKASMVLVAGCGYPDIAGNFDGLLFQFHRMFGDCPHICAAETPLLHLPSAAIATKPFLKTVKQAGAELRAAGAISPETQAYLDRPMIPGEMYRMLCNNLR